MLDCPRISSDLVLVPLEDGLLVDGFGAHEVVRGPVSQTVLPALVELMDGTRTLEQLIVSFPGVPAEYVRAAVEQLRWWNIIRKATEETERGAIDDETLSFMRRCIANAGLNRSATDAYGKLRQASVVIDAASHIDRALLRLLLEQHGVGSVALVEDDENSGVPAAETLVIAVRDSWGYEVPARYQNCRWLHTVLDERAGRGYIGPLFTPGNETCYQCFLAVQGASSEPGPTLSDAVAYCWAGLVAAEATYIIALPELGLNGRHFRRFLLPDWQSQALSYPRVPGCHCCQRGKGAPSRPPAINTAMAFEESVGLPSRYALTQTAREEFARTNVALSRDCKQLANCERIPLRRGPVTLSMRTLDALCVEKQRRRDSLTLDDVSVILAMVAGIRQISATGIQRWAATAGNLGSVELFVAAIDIRGVAPGVYFYQGEEHSLRAFRKRNALDVRELAARVLGRRNNRPPSALIMLTGALHRVARKYGSFGYRLIHLDAGCALSQLHLVSNSMELRAQTALTCADDLVEQQLNLDEGREICTAVVEISADRRTKNRRISPGRETDPYKAPSWKAPSEFRDMALPELTNMLRQESRLTEATFRLSRYRVERELDSSDPQRYPSLRLPNAATGGLSVACALAKRRTVRQYGQTSVSLLSVATMLHYAHRADAIEWSEEHRCGLGLTYIIVANAVDEVEPGVYEYSPKHHRLLRLRPALSREQRAELLVQDEYADAPLFVWIIGNLAGACFRHGAYGHKQLLIRAGAAGHRLWMATLALGMSGSVIAGVVPGAARETLGLDGYKRASLFAFTAGFDCADDKA